MSTVEKINVHVQQLPQFFQIEVLNFVEFLASKVTEKDSRQAEELWSQFSIAQAMRGLEDEDVPVYDKSDLKEKWQ
jgi:hypothetical protein